MILSIWTDAWCLVIYEVRKVMLIRGEVDLRDAIEILCYPSHESFREECQKRIETLEKIGVEKIYHYGESLVKNFRVVGKGHAAVVVLARHRIYGDVALKIRRFDSKRDSLEKEGELLRKAEVSGYTPRVFEYSRDFIVREYVNGSRLIDFLRKNIGRVDFIRRVTRSLIYSSYILDNLMIEIQEIYRPDKQVIVRNNDPDKIVYIDLESARLNNYSSNLTKILGYMLHREIEGIGILDLLNIDSSKRVVLRELARSYKRDLLRREKIVEEILRILG